MRTRLFERPEFRSEWERRDWEEKRRLRIGKLMLFIPLTILFIAFLASDPADAILLGLTVSALIGAFICLKHYI